MFEGETFEESDYKDKINKLNAIYIIFRAFDTSCHKRDKNILYKIFSLFGEDIKKNIIIIFTFADTFTNFPVLTALKNKDGPFFKILGNIEDIPYFAFNNKAYFSNERDIFKITYHKNQINFGKLIKYIFNLGIITLEKTREVLKDLEQIKSKIYNLTVKLEEIIKEVDSVLSKQKIIREDQKDLKYLEDNKIECIERYQETAEIKTVKDVTKNCSNGWYVLYCCSCNKIYHYNCRGPNEGWHSKEYGYNMVFTISGDCANYDYYCYWDRHSFRTLYQVKEEVSTIKLVEKFRENKDKKQQKENNDKLKREIRDKID